MHVHMHTRARTHVRTSEDGTPIGVTQKGKKFVSFVQMPVPVSSHSSANGCLCIFTGAADLVSARYVGVDYLPPRAHPHPPRQ